MLAILDRFGYRGRTAPVFIQSFEVGNLMDLRAESDLPLIQLMDAAGGPADRPGTSYAAMASPAGLKMIAAYADGIGPNKAMVIPRAALGRLGEPTTLVRDAHEAVSYTHLDVYKRQLLVPAPTRFATSIRSCWSMMQSGGDVPGHWLSGHTS